MEPDEKEVDQATRKLIESLDAMARDMLESPPTVEGANAVRSAIRTSEKPRLMHHLLALHKSEPSPKVTTPEVGKSLMWVLDLFDRQIAEIRRLRKYQHNARKSMRALQKAYESQLRLNALRERTECIEVEQRAPIMTGDELAPRSGRYAS